MAERTLADEIITIVQSYSNDFPAPEEALILNNYVDLNRVDIQLGDGRIFKYVKCLGGKTIGGTGVVLFPGGDYNSPVFVNDTDLSNYYTKSEVDELIEQGGGVPAQHTHTVSDITDIDTYTSNEIKMGYLLLKNGIRANGGLS